MIKQFGVILFLCGSLSSIFAQETPSLVVHGALQSDASAWYQQHTSADSAVVFSGVTMATVEVRTQQLKQAKLEGVVDIYRFFGKSAEYFFTAVSPAVSDQAPLTIDLRALYGALYLPWVDVTLGRQIINFGKGMLFSPLDVFSTVDLLELSFRRSGSDIAMAAIPVGDLSGIDVVTEFPVGTHEYSSAVRAFTTVGGWDLSATGIYRHRSQKVTGGVACKGDLVVGVTAEVVSVYNRRQGKLTFETMGGVDYSWRTTVLLNAEYWYREAAEQQLLYGRHNLFASVQYVVNDLMSVSGVVIASLPQERMLTTLQFAYNILQSVDTQWFLRYYHLDFAAGLLPDGEAGVRVKISF